MNIHPGGVPGIIRSEKMASRNNLNTAPPAGGIQKLTPSEATRIFAGMSPLRATRYYNKIMTNPNTPQENLSIVRQYREQNPQRFLSDEQMASQKNTGSWLRGRGYSGGYRPRGMVQDSDGFYYDQNNGQRYTPYGRDDGFQDGGDGGRFQGNGRANGFSNYYGAAYQRPRGRNNGYRRQQRPISEPRSYDDLYATVSGLRSDVARTRYFQKVIGNPDTPEETRKNLVRLRNNAPQMFASDDEATAAGPQVQRRGFWASHWKSQEDFDAMSPKEQKFFVKAYQGRNRYRNTSYALKVVTSETSSPEDRQAMTSVVQKNPGFFFKTRSRDRYQNGSYQNGRD